MKIAAAVLTYQAYTHDRVELLLDALDSLDEADDLLIVDNGSTDTFGDFESPRLDDFVALAIPILREQGLDIPDISAADVATNEFIDAAISMP